MPVEKSPLDAFLEKLNRLRQQRIELPPEKSYFADKPEPDREKERQQAEIRRRDEARRQAAKIEAAREGPGRPLTDTEKRLQQQFRSVTLEEGARREKEIELKFRHEETRAAALQVFLDAAEAREEADQNLYDRVTKVFDVFRRMDLSRPVPEDFARDLNQQIQRHIDHHRNIKKEINLDVDQALASILKVDNEITLSQMPGLIPYFPPEIEDQHVMYPPPGGFNREDHDPYDVGEQFAAAAEPDRVTEDLQPTASYMQIFQAIARPSRPSPSLDPDGPTPDL